jgi:hypothetical protein
MEFKKIHVLKNNLYKNSMDYKRNLRKFEDIHGIQVFLKISARAALITILSLKVLEPDRKVHFYLATSFTEMFQAN